MRLSTLSLKNFRSYEKRVVDLVSGVNVISGRNASGKTNILEAVYLLATGNSFKARVVDEMVRFGEDLGRVEGELIDNDEKIKLSVLVTKGVVAGQKTLKRKYFLDDVSKRKKDYLGNFLAVIFRPEDMDMLTGGADIRRNFLDEILSQVSNGFAQSLSVYTQALRRRNRMLDSIKKGEANRYSLTYWDGLLIKNGTILTDKRSELIDYINRLWGRSELFNELKIIYEKNIMSEERLAKYRDEELAAGYTLVGPHKDDFVIHDKNERNLAAFGSRGEQRMAVLALKLGEIYFDEEKSGIKPILLLDDIFSELDEIHKKEVLRVMTDRQVIVTTAVKDDLGLFAGENLIELGG